MRVDLGTLANGASYVKGPHISDVWKGTVYTGSGPTIAFVKLIPNHQIISELVCALLGRAVGLDVPAPLLVEVSRNVLPNYRGWLRGQDKRFGFGSEAIDHPDFRQFVGNPTDGVFREMLLQWALHRMATFFDEWVANRDRHFGNLLYDGTDGGRFWLIDHTHALTGHQWKTADLNPERMVENQLLNILTDDLSLHEKYQWKRSASEDALSFSKVNVEQCLALECFTMIATGEQRQRVETFLKQRVDKIVAMVSEKLGIKELIE